MRSKGRLFFSLFFIALAGYAAYSASRWSFKAALFPLSVSIPLIVLAGAQLLLDLYGKTETARGPAVDLEFTAEVEPEVARRRAVGIFLWIVGFISLVFLLGFPAAVPLFILSYLRLQSGTCWWQSIALTAAAWLFFYGVFERLIRLQFEAGLIQAWVGL